jgi:hypothetical protein
MQKYQQRQEEESDRSRQQRKKTSSPALLRVVRSFVHPALVMTSVLFFGVSR